jgi:hypothetical protein
VIYDFRIRQHLKKCESRFFVEYSSVERGWRVPCVKCALANTEEHCRLKVDKKEKIKPEGRKPLPDRPFERGSLISQEESRNGLFCIRHRVRPMSYHFFHTAWTHTRSSRQLKRRKPVPVKTNK